MKILHYSLGFPPYRTGGLTKFCMDLMREQVREGHEVGLIWPGVIRFFNHEIDIRKGKSIDEIKNFEIINPLPVPFDEGIKVFDAFVQEGSKKVYENFFSEIEPDVIHVHTLMGLHKSLLNVAKEKKIRLIFTAHDFFPICPKVTMFRQGSICKSADLCGDCAVCNNTALSLFKIQILQSSLYRELKDSRLVKKLRKQHRDKYLMDGMKRELSGSAGIVQDYKRLRNHFYNMLSMMDIIHYNSSVTKMVYESFFDLPRNTVIGITHSDIEDNRKRKKFSNDKLRIRYLGPQAECKGYFLLKTALDKIWEHRRDFCLDVHFSPMEPSPYIMVHGKYDYSDLEQIFEETDILVAPSLLYETFGYTVLEALSYGVPVIISGTVGAKDILADGCGIVINNINGQKVYDVMSKLDVSNLQLMNNAIVNNQYLMTINEMADKIMTKCYLGD